LFTAGFSCSTWTNPEEMVRCLAALSKPGETLAAMNYVMDTLRIAPIYLVFARGMDIFNGPLAGADRPLDAGVHLGEWFRSAFCRCHMAPTYKPCLKSRTQTPCWRKSRPDLGLVP
jgi:hypothetical protein